VDEFDTYRGRYEEEINDAIAFGGKSRDFYIKVKADLLAGRLRSLDRGRGLDVLDIGCGNGLLHPFLLSSGLPLRLTGIDVADETIAAARAANPAVTYETYDGRRLPYPGGRFDAAFAVCVMHHVVPDRWSEFLDEARRVVRPGGLVAIFEHNPFNPLTAHVVRTCRFDRNAVLLKPARLVRLMQDAGLRGLTREFVLFTPFQAPLFRSFDRMLRFVPLGAQYAVFGTVPDASA